MANLAYKAFYPAKSPFPLVHVDTGHNFPETIQYRDQFVAKLGAQLIVGLVQDSIDQGTAMEETGPNASRNALQSVTLLETIENNNLDAALGGGRRDEEKARAKERFFSIGMPLGNGILKISVQNYGIYSTVEKHTVSISVFSLSAIGQRWMFGNISKRKKLNYLRFILLIKERLLNEMVPY